MKSEEWVLAANESFVVDDISQWVQKQRDSQARRLPQPASNLIVSASSRFTSELGPHCHLLDD